MAKLLFSIFLETNLFSFSGLLKAKRNFENEKSLAVEEKLTSLNLKSQQDEKILRQEFRRDILNINSQWESKAEVYFHSLSKNYIRTLKYFKKI